ncbi:hypothetical protein BN1058_00441 [Paraliobacillus sp. PM-2]|uniref:O-antigen ligase family protein n=1 Tax=Paraliobacillus sp. PM-2 TaxID=1462524 RepID=UPI00061C8312|nr:O-antigen ligase family protein [Paraliobacillus sp. PM-2]CQR46190.1 hypothetical protein BN1058_00441 [Paraliobacillus sp. PM-2]
MKQLERDTTYKIEYSFLYFIVIQPILDLFAFLDWPISDIIRVMAILFGMIYLLFSQNKKIQQVSLLYHMILIVYFCIHLIVSYLIKDPFALTLEITHSIKTFFFMQLLFVYVTLIYSFSHKNNSWQNIILKNITISMMLIAVVMALAELTNTGKRSYGMLVKAGHTGWFFSGNELSAILAIGFGFTLLYFFRQKLLRVKIVLFGLLGVLCWSMMAIGTKVSFGGMLLFLVVGILIGCFDVFIKKRNAIHVWLPFILFIAALMWLPLSPIGQNLHITFGQSFPPSLDAEQQAMEQDVKGFDSMLSGRSDFLRQTIQQYQDAPLAQQLFGMGYGGNYQTEPKLIEMDLLDWLFGFGIIGFILLITPLFVLAIKLFKHIFLTKGFVWNRQIIIVGLIISIGFGAAMVAGHVLSSPAVSIYLAIAIGYLYSLTHPKVNKREEGGDVANESEYLSH